mmetsp:Transcript_60816/g.96332  ORF Transcript_60816/g.96332 Transcript_60816/m.96332 type:complete len:122 (+) Transcript_60816:18-383(+)
MSTTQRFVKRDTVCSKDQNFTRVDVFGSLLGTETQGVQVVTVCHATCPALECPALQHQLPVHHANSHILEVQQFRTSLQGYSAQGKEECGHDFDDPYLHHSKNDVPQPQSVDGKNRLRDSF